MWKALAPIGRDPRTGGYHRFGWSRSLRECEAWFHGEAVKRGLTLERDGNGNTVAWWRPETAAAAGPVIDSGVVTGSHLDSVPDGGAFDGPLGVVSALAALDLLRARGIRPERPLGIAVFAEEEGARFGIACLGSRLMTGALALDRAKDLRDPDGVRLVDVLAAFDGQATAAPGPSTGHLLHRPSAFVELHVEQGRGLADLDASVGLAEGIWPHGRWRFAFAGEANHAGTTRMADRHDPMLTYAMTVLAANKRARLSDREARATFGRVEVVPNGVNAVPSGVRAWLDARAPDDASLQGLVDDIRRQATERAGRDGTAVDVHAESVTPAVSFDAALRDRLASRLGGVPVLATQAGHDAGILAAAGIPTAMLFVRNPTGASHTPAEHAEPADCLAGVEALADVLDALLTTPLTAPPASHPAHPDG